MNTLVSRSKNTDYDARSREIFGKEMKISSNTPARADAVSTSGTSSVKKENGARPTCEHAAGAHLFLNAEEVVHGLLNLSSIRDPDRWLKRHKAFARN